MAPKKSVDSVWFVFEAKFALRQALGLVPFFYVVDGMIPMLRMGLSGEGGER